MLRWFLPFLLSSMGAGCAADATLNAAAVQFLSTYKVAENCSRIVKVLEDLAR